MTQVKRRVGAIGLLSGIVLTVAFWLNPQPSPSSLPCGPARDAQQGSDDDGYSRRPEAVDGRVGMGAG